MADGLVPECHYFWTKHFEVKERSRYIDYEFNNGNDI